MSKSRYNKQTTFMKIQSHGLHVKVLRVKALRVAILAVLCALLAAMALAQAQKPASSDLPDAPSTVLLPKPAPPPPTPPKTAAAAAPAPAAAKPATTPSTASAEQPAPSAKDDAEDVAASKPSQVTKAPAAQAAPKAADSDQAIETIRKRVNEVNVIFTVTDKHDRFVKDLKSSDISVLDDKKPPQSIVNFRSETDLPLRVGLLIDVSNSIRDRFKFEQEAAVEFLSQIVRPKSDRAFVIGFDTTPEVTADFTDDTEKLAKGVKMLRAGGGTALYDAVYYACRDKLGKLNPDLAVRRAIILITDGEDNQSRVTREEAIEMALRAEVTIYAISTNISGVKLRGDKVLERIADATGGRAFFPFKDQDIPSYFLAIQDELRSQYAVAYRPADFQNDGRYRSIDIIAAKKNLHVRARKGYYAPTQ
jgi:Ca-activated chloride channel family protein